MQIQPIQIQVVLSMMILFYTKHYKYVEYNETIFLLMKCNFEKFEIENNFNIIFVFF